MGDVVVDSKFKWYAIYSASNQEKSIKTNIEREIKLNGLDKWVTQVEVPTTKAVVTVKGKKILREKVLLPSYIFVYADISNGEVLPVLRQTKGVLGFINPSDGKTSNRPEALKDRDVENFFKSCIPEQNDMGIQFTVGERVRIIEGSFNTFEGVIDSIDENKKMLKLMVKIFSRETMVDVDFNHVDKQLKNIEV